jgi:hypothetical protein
MNDKARRIELRTADGKVILVLYLYEEIALEEKPKAKESPKPDAKTSNPQNARPSAENPLMTDAQKRYLFRILAEHGIEGDKAYEKLKELFQVDALKEISKLEASKMIERLLAESKGEADDRTPF